MVFKLKIVEEGKIVFIKFLTKQITFKEAFKIVKKTNYALDNNHILRFFKSELKGKEDAPFITTNVFRNIDVVFERD